MPDASHSTSSMRSSGTQFNYKLPANVLVVVVVAIKPALFALLLLVFGFIVWHLVSGERL